MAELEKTAAEIAGNDIEKGMNTILPGNNPLEGIEAVHEGGLEYSVVSIRDGKPSIHWVHLGKTPTCTCNDYKGNRKSTFDGELGSEREPCAHIVKAHLADHMEPDELAVRELINVTASISHAAAEAREAAQEARTTAKELDNGLVGVRDAQAGAVQENGTSVPNPNASNDSNTGGNPSSHSNSEEASAAAERLQDAFDEVVEGMAVEHNEGMVWVNKTPQAPDSLPGPGNVDVFQAFLQAPEQLEYVHDDHDYKGAEPGQYFSNMIRPENVDDYINGVLR